LQNEPARVSLAARFLVQVVVAEIEIEVAETGVTRGINAPDHEVPVARVDRPLEHHVLSDLPSKLLHQPLAHDRSISLGQESGLLVGWDLDFGIHREIGLRLDRELGKEIFRALIGPTEPIGPGYALDALHGLEARHLGLPDRESEPGCIRDDQPTLTA